MISPLTLFLVAQVCAEWVEISQQHYRKPTRIHSPFVTRDKVTDLEETTKPWAYTNRSVTEYNWNKNPARIPNSGNVKRVQLIGTTVKPSEKVKFEEELDQDLDSIDYELVPNNGPKKITSKVNEDGKQKGTIVKVPNVGNVKRVQLNNSPVKSPAVDIKEERGNNYDRYKKQTNDLQTEANEFKNKKTTETYNQRIYVNQLKKHGTERTATFPPYDEDLPFIEEVATFNKKDRKPQYKNYTNVKNVYTTKPTFLTEIEDSNNYENQKNRFYKITASKSSDVTEKINIYTTEGFDNAGDIVTKSNVKKSKPTKEDTTKNNSYKNVNDFDPESHENKVHPSDNKDKQVILVDNDHKTDMKANSANSKQDPQSENRFQEENFKQNIGVNDIMPDGAKTNSGKVNTMEIVVKFMKVVADTISKNSRRSFGGKMQYLHELKDSILANIGM